MRSLENYCFHEVIGKGAFGEVFRATDPTGRTVAVKMINLEEDASRMDDSLRELDILRKLRFKNIVQFYDAHLESYAGGASLWLSMEYCRAGSCRRLLKAYGAFDEPSAVYVLNQVLQGLNFLHRENIIYRDLKTANILITAKSKIKLCDFGVSAQLTNQAPARNTLAGTPQYMAPEVISGEDHNTKADIWSLGIVAIELVTGEIPYSNLPQLKVMDTIVHQDPPTLTRQKGPNNLSASYIGFVVQCLRKLAAQRPQAAELLKQGWIGTRSNPPWSFTRVVRSSLYKADNREHRRVVQSSQLSDSEDYWDFPSPRVAPPVPRAEEFHFPSANISRSRLSTAFVVYFEKTFERVIRRCRADTAKSRTAMLRNYFRYTDIHIPDFCTVLVQEEVNCQALDMPLGVHLDQMLLRAEERYRLAIHKRMIESLRKEIGRIEKGSKGYSVCFVQELQYIMTKYPRAP